MEEYSGYQELANQIVFNAAQDYRNALKRLNCRNLSETTRDQVNKLRKECERFFTGSWIKALTTLDGVYLMDTIKKEILSVA